MNAKTPALIIILLLTMTGLAFAAESATETFQKGLFEEEGNHDLAAAIQAYQTVISQFDEQRKIAANAIFRLGECYRKQGKTNEANAQYERVLREFSEQVPLARLSREYLGADSSGEKAFASVTIIETIRALERELLSAEGDLAVKEALLNEVKKAPDAGKFLGLNKELQDEQMERLSSDLSKAEQDFAVLITNYSKDHPEVQGKLALIKTIQSQIANRFDVVRLALQAGIATQKSRLETVRNRLHQAREEYARRNVGSPVTQPLSAVEETATTSEEAKEIERLKILVKNSPDLVNAAVPAQSGDTPLRKAARSGQLEVAKFLLAHNAEVNPAGCAPLHEAARNGHKTMTELLLAQGAKVNGKEQAGTTPLHYAAYYGFASVAQVLLAHGAEVNAKSVVWAQEGNQPEDSTPLHCAATKGFKAMVELLLGNGADVNAQNKSGATPLHLTLQANQVVVVKALLDHKASVNVKDNRGYTPLHTAVAFRNLEGAQLVLEHQADPNAETASLPNSPSWIPLKAAVEREDKPMVELLLAHGANPSQKVAGTTPLHIAVGKGNIAITELLLSHKADVNAKSDFLEAETPLQVAILNGRKDLAELLLSHKADVDAKDPLGSTPLHYAVRTGRKDIVELLLANKADINARNNEGMTPLDLTSPSGSPTTRTIPQQQLASGPGGTAVLSNPSEIAELLKKNGAKSAQNQVSLSGQVLSTTYPWYGNDGTTLAQVLFKGGLKSNPDLRNVKLIRLNPQTGQAEETTVDFEAINEAIQIGDRSKDVLLKDGDRVVVPEKP